MLAHPTYAFTNLSTYVKGGDKRKTNRSELRYQQAHLMEKYNIKAQRLSSRRSDR